jgi:hypothetical protein
VCDAVWECAQAGAYSVDVPPVSAAVGAAVALPALVQCWDSVSLNAEAEAASLLASAVACAPLPAAPMLHALPHAALSVALPPLSTPSTGGPSTSAASAAVVAMVSSWRWHCAVPQQSASRVTIGDVANLALSSPVWAKSLLYAAALCIQVCCVLRAACCVQRAYTSLYCCLDFARYRR